VTARKAQGGDRHEHRPVGWRPSAVQRAAMLAAAAEDGRTGDSDEALLRQVIGVAVAEYLARRGGVPPG
jgi:hypothetical protein